MYGVHRATVARWIVAAQRAIVDAVTTRLENEVRFGAANVIPLFGAFSFVQQVDYLRTYANLPNYARDNWSVTLGGIWRF